MAKDRAAAVNPRINAIVRDVPASPATDTNGPFAGVPFLIKDLAQDYAGQPTARGSRALMSQPAAEHATVVRRWLDAGLVIFGKTNTPEFGAKGVTEPDAWGPTRNPWDLTRTPGRLVGRIGGRRRGGHRPVRRGQRRRRIHSHPGGLLRAGRPEARPRADARRVPATGEPMHGAAVQGVVSRTVRDTAAMLDVIRGGEPCGPYVPEIPDASFASCVGADPGPLRIGVRVPSAITPTPHPEAYAAVETTVRALTELGHHVEELPQAPFDDAALAREFLLTWFVYVAWEVDEAKRLTGRGRRVVRTRHADHGRARAARRAASTTWTPCHAATSTPAG